MKNPVENLDLGYLGPKRLSTEHFPYGKYEDVLLDRFIPTSQFTWYKSTHEKSVKVRELAKNPEIIEAVKKFIGKDVILG